ncbi:MAG TPA: rhomboid family intramembrane serine protease, partial [Burkholderiales bacterium]|nr:rhomboid family intramembrane serine protease [Burkholderiales bacterium]
RVWATPALVFANIGVWVATVLAGAHPLSPSGEMLIAWGANFAPLTAAGEWWRLPAAAFLHSGVLHLALNMWALWDAGRLVERLYGSVSFLLIYLAAGVAGSFASALWHPEGVVSIGASGAVFGVLGALGAFLAVQKHSVPRRVVLGLRASVLTFMGYALLIGFLVPGIDNAAHLGGMAAGFVLGAILARPLTAPDRGRMLALRFPAAAAAAALLTGALAWWMPPPAYDMRLERAMQQEVARFGGEEKAILDAWRAAADARKAMRIDDAELARRMLDAAQRWDAAYARLAAVKLSEGSPSRERLALLLRYAELRRDSTRLIAEAVRDGDAAKMNRARSLAAEMDQVRQAIEKPGTATKGKDD